MIGLAPTAKAAEVLADSLAIPAENTAKWLTESNENAERRARLRELMDQATNAETSGRRRSCHSFGREAV